MRGATAIAFLSCAIVSACSHTGPGTFLSDVMDILWRAPAAGNAVRGKHIAERRCAACHALEAVNVSGGAESFPELSTRSDLTATKLSSLLSHLPHPMPAIMLPEQDVKDLIAYIHASAILP